MATIKQFLAHHRLNYNFEQGMKIVNRAATSDSDPSKVNKSVLSRTNNGSTLEPCVHTG